MDRGKTASWFSGACGAPEIMNVIPGSGLKGHRYCEHVVYPVQPPDVKRGTKTQGAFKAQRRRTLARANPAWRKTTLQAWENRMDTRTIRMLPKTRRVQRAAKKRGGSWAYRAARVGGMPSTTRSIWKSRPRLLDGGEVEGLPRMIRDRGMLQGATVKDRKANIKQGAPRH
jgi:hypothetical protein